MRLSDLPCCLCICTLCAQDDWGWGIVVSVLKKPKHVNAAVNGGAAIANAAAVAAAGEGDDVPVDLKALAANAASCYIVDTLLPCKAGSVAAGMARPDPIGIGAAADNAAAGAGAAAAADGTANGDAAPAGSSAELTVVPVLLPLVTSLSSLRVTLPDDIRGAEVRQSLLCVLQVCFCSCCWAIAHMHQAAILTVFLFYRVSMQ